MLRKRIMILLTAAAVSAALALTGGCSVKKTAGQQTESQTEDKNDRSAEIFSMGTVFSARVIGQDAQSILEEADDAIYKADDLISYRKEDSLTADFNSQHKADVSPISDLMQQTLDISKKSKGAFDPTVLPLTQVWQFDRMQEEDFDVSSMKVPDQASIDQALEHVDYKKLDFDKKTGLLSTSDPDQKLELGAVGKGFAIDQAMSVIREKKAKGALISAGSSIGLMGVKEDGSSFTVALRDPRGDEGDYIGLFHTTDCTISTSGDYERYFEYKGKRYHHILDPHTGYPSDSGLMQVTILCSSGSLGDALSTACFALGLDEGMKLAKEYNVLAIFVDNDRHIWYNNTGLSDIFEFTGKDSGYTLSEYNK